MSYVHEYTGVSSIANDAAYAAIVSYVLEDLQKYMDSNDDEDEYFDVDTYNNDVAYINNVLAQFEKTRNVDNLIQSIAEQDTYVREYYSYIVEDLHSDYYNGEWA
jgi:hypothetical protein